ncbi:MAG: Ldh family oxidoreductase, partial [Rubrivivax sp.]
MRLTLQALTTRVEQVLVAAGATPAMAASTARALVLAEAQGQGGHGLARVAQYATHLRNGRVNPRAVPTVVRRTGGALLVDADEGLAFPACELALAEAVAAARVQGVVFAGVTNSHHCGVLVDHLRAAAAAGMVGLGFTNSPAAMPAAGGRHPIFGTNPVAAVFPRRAADPLLIDLSLSEVARGKVMLAAKQGKPIPE